VELSLVVALVALLIAAASLYLTVFRNERVELDVLDINFRGFGRSGGQLSTASLSIDATLTDLGARSAVVQSVGFENVIVKNGTWQPRPEVYANPSQVMVTPPYGTMPIRWSLGLNYRAMAEDLDAFHGAFLTEEASLPLTWVYFGSTGLPIENGPRWLRHRRRRVHRTRRVVLPVADQRQSIAEFWRGVGRPEFAEEQESV
jgi:hypothetical protein